MSRPDRTDRAGSDLRGPVDRVVPRWPRRPGAWAPPRRIERMSDLWGLGDEGFGDVQRPTPIGPRGDPIPEHLLAGLSARPSSTAALRC